MKICCIRWADPNLLYQVGSRWRLAFHDSFECCTWLQAGGASPPTLFAGFQISVSLFCMPYNSAGAFRIGEAGRKVHHSREWVLAWLVCPLFSQCNFCPSFLVEGEAKEGLIGISFNVNGVWSAGKCLPPPYVEVFGSRPNPVKNHGNGVSTIPYSGGVLRILGSCWGGGGGKGQQHCPWGGKENRAQVLSLALFFSACQFNFGESNSPQLPNKDKMGMWAKKLCSLQLSSKCSVGKLKSSNLTLKKTNAQLSRSTDLNNVGWWCLLHGKRKVQLICSLEDRKRGAGLQHRVPARLTALWPNRAQLA